MNYKVLAISLALSAVIFGYMLLETKKLDDAAAAHATVAAHAAAAAR